MEINGKYKIKNNHCSNNTLVLFSTGSVLIVNINQFHNPVKLQQQSWKLMSLQSTLTEWNVSCR